MRPNKYIKKAEQERRRQRSIAKSYLNAGPSIVNLYNAARAFWNSLPIVGINAAQMNPYMMMGDAPTGGKIKGGLRILSPSQIKTLAPRDRKAYTDAIDRITYRDALRQKIDSDPQYPELYDQMQEDNAVRYADRNWVEDDHDWDPELELLEYSFGGTDTYDLVYKDLMRKRLFPRKK